MHYLNNWCHIRHQKITKNGQTIFEDEQADTGTFLLNAYKQLAIDYPKFYKMDNLCKLAFLAAESLLDGTSLPALAPAEDLGIVLANHYSSLDTDIHYLETAQSFPSPSLFVYTLANVMVGEVCIRHKLKGENTVFIFDNYEIPFLCGYIDDLLAINAASAVIGGWVDVMENHYEAFLYLASHLNTENSLFHDHKIIETLYGKPDTGFENPDH
ncbi:MAG: hypothetical protein KDD27_12750 [Saprospiraceae bacterium]|nr:hypothetical protein [Saprospiraceae bacterium]